MEGRDDEKWIGLGSHTGPHELAKLHPQPRNDFGFFFVRLAPRREFPERNPVSKLDGHAGQKKTRAGDPHERFRTAAWTALPVAGGDAAWSLQAASAPIRWFRRRNMDRKGKQRMTVEIPAELLAKYRLMLWTERLGVAEEIAKLMARDIIEREIARGAAYEPPATGKEARLPRGRRIKL